MPKDLMFQELELKYKEDTEKLIAENTAMKDTNDKLLIENKKLSTVNQAYYSKLIAQTVSTETKENEDTKEFKTPEELVEQMANKKGA